VVPCIAAIAARLRSLLPSEPSLTFAEVTALLLSCVEPTLFRGRLAAA
jgi:hypothetical protein